MSNLLSLPSEKRSTLTERNLPPFGENPFLLEKTPFQFWSLAQEDTKLRLLSGGEGKFTKYIHPLKKFKFVYQIMYLEGSGWVENSMYLDQTE